MSSGLNFQRQSVIATLVMVSPGAIRAYDTFGNGSTRVANSNCGTGAVVTWGFMFDERRAGT
jgi:hypothetical protein